VLIVQDPTLLHQVDVFQGLKKDGLCADQQQAQLRRTGPGDIRSRFRRERLTTVPATEIALKHLGRPLPNVPCCWAASRRCRA
jgi:pyruvate ferredoxin oxidoreductase gamma subunit